jgi:aspartyl-tRNA synthetase
MALRLRRGTTAELALIPPLNGELLYDVSTKSLYIGDGTTAGGKLLASGGTILEDIVLNGNEIGGGSIRIHDRAVQERMFALLGFTPEEAQEQFGFLLNAFEYGAPPHGGIAFGFDRLVALLGGDEVIRDYIAFPKNNAGRDVMIDAPSPIDNKQLTELHLGIKP